MADRSIRSITRFRRAQHKGRQAEKRALAHLKRCGLVPIAANFRCRMGEIDLVMKDGDTLVIIEVRYRAQNGFASAACSIDRHKQARIIRTAALFLSRSPQYANDVVRFDIVAFNQIDGRECELQWIKDAFRPD